MVDVVEGNTQSCARIADVEMMDSFSSVLPLRGLEG